MSAVQRKPRGWAWLWLLGLQSWLLWVVVPRVYHKALSPEDLAWALLPACILGLSWWTAGRKCARSPLLNLTVFPACLAAALSSFDDQQALSTYSIPLLVAGGLSMLAFAAAASAIAASPEAVRQTSVQSLGSSHLTATDPRRARWQRGLLVGTGLALLGIVVWGSRDTALHYHENWGSTAAAGATLTSIASGLVGAIAMAGVIGPAMRAERPGHAQKARDVQRRTVWLSAVALSGLTAYLLLIVEL